MVTLPHRLLDALDLAHCPGQVPKSRPAGPFRPGVAGLLADQPWRRGHPDRDRTWRLPHHDW